MDLQRHGLDHKCRLLGVYNTIGERNEFMESIDVFVLPSLTEGTPNAIIEAMAHQKPIVATNVGGIPDLVSDDTGILVPPNDVEALANALGRLAGDSQLLQTMGIAARKRYEQFFTPQAVLPLLVDFYERLASQNGAANNGKVPAAHPWAEFNN